MPGVSSQPRVFADSFSEIVPRLTGAMRISPDRGKREAIPEAVLGMIDQFPFHRIHVHVLEVFDFLFLTSHIEPKFPDYWGTANALHSLHVGVSYFSGASKNQVENDIA
jgi:hypothetical protein